MKCRLIYDMCTPTRDRRPTTSKDVEQDICLEEFESEQELLDKLLDLAGYDEEDLEDYDLPINATINDKIEAILGYFTDPGDGSPNILYVSIDGKEVEGTLPYDCLDELDLETCSEEEVIQSVKSEFAEDEEDEWVYVCLDSSRNRITSFEDEDEAIEFAEQNSKVSEVVLYIDGEEDECVWTRDED